jgi:hypothetical protein
MAIERPKDARQQAIASVQRCFRENMGEKFGNIAASGLPSSFRRRSYRPCTARPSRASSRLTAAS